MWFFIDLLIAVACLSLTAIIVAVATGIVRNVYRAIKNGEEWW